MAIDPHLKADVNIDFTHYKIHRGEMYHMSHYITVTAASIYQVIMITGDTAPHVIADVQASGQTLLTVYEGPTVTAAATGSVIAPRNMERESTKSCTARFFYGGTYSINAATNLFYDIIPGGNNPSTKFGGAARKNSEWVLKPSTVYLFRFTNQAGTTVTSSFNVEFYELNV